jgi:hypothetical protein
MKLIKSRLAKNVKFRWIEEHYDVHLSGTCIYKGELCYFDSDYPDFGKEQMCDIYELTYFEKLKWRFTQWLFELCIGYHWTYDKDGRVTHEFKLRKPKWLYKFLFNIYYYKP